MSRLARTMLIGIALSLAVVVLGVGLVFVNLLGGFDNLFHGPRPQETDPEVVAAAEHASQELRASGQPLALATVASTAGGWLATGEVRTCTVGQHGWKRDDPYDLLCDLARLQVVTSPSVAGFRDQMVSLDAALKADGWAPEGAFGLERVLTDYWDERASFSSRYGVDNLPAATYGRGSGEDRRTLGVKWATADSESYAISYAEDSLVLEFVGGGETTLGEVLGAIPVEGYAVVLTESMTYYDE